MVVIIRQVASPSSHHHLIGTTVPSCVQQAETAVKQRFRQLAAIPSEDLAEVSFSSPPTLLISHSFLVSFVVVFTSFFIFSHTLYTTTQTTTDIPTLSPSTSRKQLRNQERRDSQQITVALWTTVQRYLPQHPSQTAGPIGVGLLNSALKTPKFDIELDII